MHGFDEFSSGDLLGKYKIVRELGRGGMGVVYLAEDTQLQRDIALKLLNPWLNSDQDFVDRFRVEARSIAKMLHPNIVHVNSFDSLDGHLAIDMEYVDGYALHHYLASQALNVPRVARIAADVLTGLCVCHNTHVIHRDIKPGNILVKHDGRAKLGDFGIATAYAAHMEAAISRTSSSGFCLGTPRYAPPELWDGATPTPAWDLYAVGMVMYEALAGKPAYEGNNPYALIRQIDSRPVPRLDEVMPSVSRELADLVHTLLHRNPDERPDSAAAALNALVAVPEFPDSGEVTELPTLRVPIAIDVPPSTRRRRPPVSKLAAAVLATGLVFALAYLVPGAYRSYLGSRGYDVPAVQFQDQVQQTEAASADVILKCFKSKDGPENWFFDAVLLDGADRARLRWMMEAPHDRRTSTITAIADRSLWTLRMTEGPNQQLQFDGDWAEYRDDAATIFHQGSVTGTGLWSVPNVYLTASLTFKDGNDNSIRSRTISATKHPNPFTDTAFVYAMEEASLLQPLIYHELLPRQYAWAKRIESLVPCVTDASVVARFERIDSSELKVDGKLSEAFWQETALKGDSRVTQCPGAPYNRDATLRVRSVEDGLLLGLSVRLQSEFTPSIELAVQPGLAATTDDSPMVVASRTPGGEITGHIAVRTIELHWDPDWQIADSFESGVWQAEVYIPMAGMAKLRPGPATDPWRLNCSISQTRPDGKQDLLVRWGFPNVHEVIHGVKIFVEPPVSPTGPANQGLGPKTTGPAKESS